ncbi:terpene synthase family protein [Streptomyces beigongshangae]|uniref:terpene synthase family protein n=1 Tax=Streptomyces beigongshangae TaxID=2841597 RepID=UPI001C85F7AC|nr:hypothetical protein [Streptomyces sp. REN17]
MNESTSQATAPTEAVSFFCPIEPSLHPDVHIVRERAESWLSHHGYFGSADNRPRSLATRSAEFSARMTPTAQTDRLQVAAEWTYWGFAFDDTFCDAEPWSGRPAEFAELSGRMGRMLEAPGYTPTDSVHLQVLAELRDRFARFATPLQHRRWVLAQRAWLMGVTWQISNQSRGLMPSLDDYLAMRINSAAGEPVTSMIEMVNGAEVPSGEMELLSVRACTEMSRTLASLDNDLHSYAKDVRRREADQNIVNVIAGEQSCGTEAAVRAAMGVRDRIMCRFLRVRAAVAGRASTATRWYLTDLGHVVRGNLDWGLSTPRYHLDVPAEPVTSWAESPSDAGQDPPAPCVAWWWDRSLV